MKRTLIGLCALTLAVPAAALELPDAISEPSVFVNFEFGAARAEALRLGYGLRLDSRWREHDDLLPPVMALDFTGAGLAGLRVGGVPLAGASMMLSQNEGGPGLRFWDWGLQQWGMVAGAGVIAFAATSYEDPPEDAAAAGAEAEPTACGDDVPQPVFGPGDCI